VLFYKTQKNGEEVLRTWLLYSNTDSWLHCFCCKLFRSRHDVYLYPISSL